MNDECDLDNKREVRLTGFSINEDALRNGVTKNCKPGDSSGVNSVEDRLGNTEDPRRDPKSINGAGEFSRATIILYNNLLIRRRDDAMFGLIII